MAAEYEQKATTQLGNQEVPHDGLLWYLQAWLFYKAILEIAVQHVILWPFLNMTVTDLNMTVTTLETKTVYYIPFQTHIFWKIYCAGF